MEDNDIIACTGRWIRSVVIAHNFCPFAAKVTDADGIHFSICRSKKPTGRIRSLQDEINYLDHNREAAETSFLIFPETLNDFRDYLDFVKQAENFLKIKKLSNHYQLASFHNDYCFSGLLPEDAANYTNRSPFPMIHILRVKSVSKAIAWFGETEMIPARNIAYAREKGAVFMKDILEKCR